jgi:hypothetical protein
MGSAGPPVFAGNLQALTIPLRSPRTAFNTPYLLSVMPAKGHNSRRAMPPKLLQNFAIVNWKMARDASSPSEHDVALRRCPITRSEARAMIAEVKGARLLQGFRGRPVADLEALADTLVRVSNLAIHLEGHLAELDINPLMVLPSGQGVKAVDALVVFRGT